MTGAYLPSPRQIRAGRACLGWSQAELASAAGITWRTVASVERAEHPPRRTTLEAIRDALEQAGISWVDHPGEGACLVAPVA